MDMPIARHRTALARRCYSQPVSMLMRHGLVRPGTTVFDYGCGQGDDLRSLALAGVAATGWDPHFAPDAPRIAADVVNLGFVLNVIEDPVERELALRTAWSLADAVLAVSTMVVGQVPTAGLPTFGDGCLTSRATFQKYFEHAELRGYVRAVTGVDPVSVAPGIFFAFRRPEEEQEFLLERRRGNLRPALLHAARATRRDRKGIEERIAPVLEEIFRFAMRRGRPPHADEFDPDARARLAAERCTPARAVAVFLASDGASRALAEVAEVRREDLLVHQALGVLDKTRSASSPSRAMERDVKALFGCRRGLAEAAVRYLHSLADATEMHALCAASVGKGLGAMDERHRLVIDGDRLDKLAGQLRVYAGCAAHLHGEPVGPFLLRLDPLRKRVSFFALEDRRARRPVVAGGATVDLKRRSIHVRVERRRLLRKADVFGQAEVGRGDGGAMFEPLRD